MPDSLADLFQQFSQNSEWQATLLVATVGIAGLLYLLRVQLRNWRRERNTGKILRRLAARIIEDIRLPDGTGGEVTIEYLLLTRDALVIVGIMRFDGIIFGGRLTDQWIQVLGRRSYKFDNPNHYLQRQINAVTQLVGGITVTGMHLFTSAKFPKDKPNNILLLSDLKTLPKRPRPGDIPKPLRVAWKQLLAAVDLTHH